ncbi:unnamed protein product [Linum tenue]|uniref:Pectate lyase n=1 Tax=Linum tenue TaxID=586396 RepID=A0AAV0KWD5_9ROSI|nr:unnamed protein product [Linum tenue]
MAIKLSLLLLLALLQFPTHISTSPVSDPESVAEEVDRQGTRSTTAGDATRSGTRTASASPTAQSGSASKPSAVGTVKPKPGTLRYAAIQNEPLWIVFARDMVIKLKAELMMNSFKTIDGRGSSVHIAGGPCITIQYVTNVIIHGINIHDCKKGGNLYVRDSPEHFGWRTVSDGDGVSIFGGSHVWVDHCSLSNCADGLIDAIHGSTAITISNNYMTHHNKVMLLGHNDGFTRDRSMQVTIAFNHFGEGLVQRMPRCRHGYFHVVNNDYTHWQMYAIGGSAAPTINSQGNRFLAPDDRFNKEVLYFFQSNHTCISQ